MDSAKMNLTNENYYSTEANSYYMSSTQFKDFQECEACALAKIKGEYVEPTSTALLVGGYVDAYFSGELESYKEAHPEILKKDGTLLKDFVKAEEIINFINKDPVMVKYLGGEHQVIMTGEIAGVPFKIKIDSYFPDKCIVDQKIMKDLLPIWDEEEHCKKNLVEYYLYDLQLAIYQEIVYQNTGKKLRCVLAITTKENVPNKALIEIDQERLDKMLEIVKKEAPRFSKIKKGLIKPNKCNKCDYCKSDYMITGVFPYHILDPQ